MILTAWALLVASSSERAATHRLYTYASECVYTAYLKVGKSSERTANTPRRRSYERARKMPEGAEKALLVVEFVHIAMREEVPPSESDNGRRWTTECPGLPQQ